MKLSKLLLITQNPKEFARWAIATQNKVPKHLRKDFTSTWPTVQNTSEHVRGAFVVHWSLIVGGTFNRISVPMMLGSMTYMQMAAMSVGREDLAQVLQTMMQNINRIHHEITLANGGEDEEE